MSAYLLALTVGPVQEFIAAARRTRDLWFGSNLLSEISKAAARAVQDHGGALIFPAPSSAADLGRDSDLNVANVILAELDGIDPQSVAQHARDAAQARWREYANPAFDKYSARDIVRADIWNDQVQDVIEFYAAWVSLSDDYQAARARVMRLLAGRKNCRNFLPAYGRAGVPKSSLDGLRESVLTDPVLWPEGIHRSMRIRKGEQLDVVGLVKRTATGARSYPSVDRVAADPWIRGVGDAGITRLRQACEQLNGAVTRCDDRYRQYRTFPFEGAAVYRARHHEFGEEAALSDDDLGALNTTLADLTRKYGEPNPYLAVLVADGDQMGQALSKLDRDEHRRFSRALSGFADDARQIVEKHYGVLVYAGGDDVLAFIPVDLCLACARALHDRFGQVLQDFATTTEINLTLSVGLAIAHFMEDLEDLLDYGRAAEKNAKNRRFEDSDQQERDGLAVHLVKRGGGPIAIRANWSDNPDTRLTELAKCLNDRAIPGRVAADLHQVAQVYENWPASSVKEAIQQDALRAIALKQPRGDSALPRVRELIVGRVTDAASLRRMGDELLVARQIAIAVRLASGKPPIDEVSE